ncbi:MAG: transposase, partial [Bacteroidota bacterium]
IVLGVTVSGDKVPLGFIQTATENSQSIGELFSDLIERGLSVDQGLLVVIDGAKGIRKAVQAVFGTKAIVQRCQ